MPCTCGKNVCTDFQMRGSWRPAVGSKFQPTAFRPRVLTTGAAVAPFQCSTSGLRGGPAPDAAVASTPSSGRAQAPNRTGGPDLRGGAAHRTHGTRRRTRTAVGLRSQGGRPPERAGHKPFITYLRHLPPTRGGFGRAITSRRTAGVRRWAPPLPVGPAGRAPRLRRLCKRGSLPRERSLAGGSYAQIPRGGVSEGGTGRCAC